MQELKIETLHGQVVIDKCESCSGLWFDNGEAEQLKGDWMAEFADSGDPEVGKSYNTVRDIQCPRCGKTMKKLTFFPGSGKIRCRLRDPVREASLERVFVNFRRFPVFLKSLQTL